jgi:hypothetical protein
MVVQRGVERVGEEAQRRDRERARSAGRIADLEREDLLGEARRPLDSRRIAVRLAPLPDVGRRVGQRAQRALHRGDGEPGARVERARALARPAPAHEVPLAGKHDAHHELARLASHRFVERCCFSGVSAPLGRLTSLPIATARRAHCLGARARHVALVLGGGILLQSSDSRVRRIGARRRLLCDDIIGILLRIFIVLVRIVVAFPRPRRLLARVLHLLEQVGERFVVHLLEARERERRLVADVEEDDGSPGGAVLSSKSSNPS